MNSSAENETLNMEIPSESASRARLFAQEREKQLLRRQQSVSAQELRNTSLPRQGQYTPAIRQFSTPKGVAESYLNDADISEDRPKFPAKPTIFRAFDASNIILETPKKEGNIIYAPDRIKRRPPIPRATIEENAQKNSSPPRVRAPRPPSGPTPQPYQRSEPSDSGEDASDESSLPTDDEEGEVESQAQSDTEMERDDDETKEAEEQGEVEHSILLEGATEVRPTSSRTKLSHKFSIDQVPEQTDSTDDKQVELHRRHRRDDDTNPMTPPSSVARPGKMIHTIDLSDMKRFLMNPIPKSVGVVQCYIKRNRSGMNKLHPIYSIYLKDGDKFLMSARKRANNKTSNYLISMSEYDMNRGSANYLGKLRSNFVGTEFQIYDDGVNPKDSDDGPSSRSQKAASSNQAIRKELGIIIYAPNVLGSRGPRKMQVAIPEVDEHSGNIFRTPIHSRGSVSSTTSRQSLSDSFVKLARRFSLSSTMETASPSDYGSPREYEDMLSMVKDRCYRNVNYYINKPPRWNDQVGAYVLNFGGRVTMASVKNFQLCDPDELDDVAVQFGRVGKEEFNMDLKWPMSPFQAFAITLSSFDSKIACD